MKEPSELSSEEALLLLSRAVTSMRTAHARRDYLIWLAKRMRVSDQALEEVTGLKRARIAQIVGEEAARQLAHAAATD